MANLGRLRKVKKHFAPVERTVNSKLVFFDRALLECGHTIERNKPIRQKARCYQCPESA